MKFITHILTIPFSLSILFLSSGCGDKETLPGDSALQKQDLNVSIENNDTNNSINLTTGTAIDGYLSGATACIDANNDGVANDEVCTQTDDFGEYNLPASLVAANPVAITGGTDVLTGEAYVGSMSAPAGATVVTPLTTLVNAVVKSGKTVEEAQKSVNVALGLPETTSLTTLDPIRATVEGDTATADAAKTVIAVQTKVQVIQQTLATTIKSASGDVIEESDAASAIADQMATIIITETTKTNTIQLVPVLFNTTELREIVINATLILIEKATAEDDIIIMKLEDLKSTIVIMAEGISSATSEIADKAKDTLDKIVVSFDVTIKAAGIIKIINNELTAAVKIAVENKTTTLDTSDIIEKIETVGSPITKVKVVNPTPIIVTTDSI